ncbi:MAG: hypothetical protein U0840_13280 [Gemmataceae bacterium]
MRLLLASLFCLPLLLAQNPSSSWYPPLNLQGKNRPISTYLAELSRHGGFAIADLRSDRDKVTSATLDLPAVSLWQGLEVLAERTGARVQFAREGGLVLVSAPTGYRPPPTSYDGPFRLRVVRVTSSRDLELQASSTVVTVELAWLPSLLPLFVDTHLRQVHVTDSKNTPLVTQEEGGSLTPVDGRYSFPLELTVSGVPRSESRLASITGEVRAVVPSKFLTFRFDADLVSLQQSAADSALRRLVQDQVICRVERLVVGPDRWSVQVSLAYPPGGKSLESYQASSLVINNELRLVTSDGRKSLVSSGNLVEFVSSRRALVTYHFTDRPGQKRGSLADWKLQYRAPARILEVPIRFKFQDVPLP